MEKEIYWSRFAADFEKRNTYVIGVADFNLVKQRISEQQNLGKVLELGCGNGTYSGLLARNAEHVWATDFSDEMVATAQQNLNGRDTITVEKQNCFQTRYENGQFDTLVMVNLLHVIPDPEKALEEAKRVLRPGGRIFILSFTTEGMGAWDKLSMIYRYLKTYGRPPGTSRHLCQKSVKDLLFKTGFTVLWTDLIGERSRAVWASGLSGG